MEPESSLLHSKEPATCPYPEPDLSSPCPHTTSWRFILILSSHLRLGLQSDLFTSGSPSNTLWAPLISPCILHTPPISFFLKFRSNVLEIQKDFFRFYIEITDIYIYMYIYICTRFGTLIVATIYLQLIQNRYMFRSFTVLQCSHQHCVQPVASDVEVLGYL